jgi:nucleotide-binding universal stress UspA family protein
MSGTPEKVIASAATELDADILVIASVADVEWPFFGNTAQKVIDEIDIDVLVLPMTA